MVFSGVSIVLPAYNEAENIDKILLSALAVLQKLGGEVIVVDDGSSDQTAARVNNHIDKRVRLVQHGENLGYGAALRSGFACAQYDWVFFTDSDCQFDLQQIHDWVDYTEQFDLVVGYRAPRQDPLVRVLNARVWAQLVNTTFGLSILDVNCAFKLIRRDLLHSVCLESQGACINAEMFVKLLGRGARLKQLPVRHFPRSFGRQTGARPDVIFRALRELVSLKIDARARKP